MTALSVAGASKTAALPGRPQAKSSGDRPARLCDLCLDLLVVVLASWTLAYHVCLIARWGVRVAVPLELVCFAVCCWVWRWCGRGAEPSPVTQTGGSATRSPTSGSLPVVTAGVTAAVSAAVSAAVIVATAGLISIDTGWRWIAALWLITGLGGTAFALLGRPEAGGTASTSTAPTSGESRSWGRALEPYVVGAWAILLGALSAVTVAPNADDVFYLNFSQWVTDHGTFPLRDTIFSNQAYPMTNWPPIASYDALTGVVARLCATSAARVEYIGVTPVATAVSVLVMWRLLRCWRAPQMVATLSVSLLFLVFDGGEGYESPGAMFFTRIWQGKALLLCIGVPLLIVYGLAHVKAPSHRSSVWLFIAGVAAGGLSTTAIFLVPLLALAVALPLVGPRRTAALETFGAMSCYPLLMGVASLVVHGHSADDFGARRLYRFDPSWFGHEVFNSGPIAFIAVVAVLAAAFTLPDRSARLVTSASTCVFGVTLIPGLTHIAYRLTGLGPTLWRLSWLLTIAPLVGMLSTSLWSRVPPLRRGRAAHGVAVMVLLSAAVVAFGTPIWLEGHSVRLAVPLALKRPAGTAAPAERLTTGHAGDLVLSPKALAITLEILTTRVHSVAPRVYAMADLRHEPGFDYGRRLRLMHFADHPVPASDLPRVARDLDVLGVDVVCLPAQSAPRLAFLGRIGFRTSLRVSPYACLRRKAR